LTGSNFKTHHFSYNILKLFLTLAAPWPLAWQERKSILSFAALAGRMLAVYLFRAARP
jgi:hypothetical protein